METNRKILAIKYRPQIFEDLIGQDIIVEALKKSIKQNSIPHAYLFTGIRGVGKTTVARILAKSLNCVNGQINDCKTKKCNNCEEISESRHIDVLEIDAASKTGVDDVRDLIEFSRYPPTSSKFKIFIIDEVHMLSKQAFNALLKTLEEPPKYLKFIFATTEVTKIPITVLSRCQRFDLMRVEFEKLLKFLKNVLNIEKNNLPDDVIKLIIKISEGSVRDALSLMDRILLNTSEDNKKVDLKLAYEVFGYLDKSYLIDLLEKLLRGDEVNVIALYRNIYNKGIEPKLFLNNFLEIIYYLKNLKNFKKESFRELNDNEFESLEKLYQRVDNKTLFLFWQFTVDAISEINLVSNQNLSVEMFLVRLLYLRGHNKSSNNNSNQIIEGIENSEKNNQTLKTNKKKENLNNNNQAINQIKISSQKLTEVDLEKKKIRSKNKIQSISELIEICSQKKEIGLKFELENNVNLVSFKSNTIEISFNDNLDKNFIKNLTLKLLEWTGERWIITLSKKNGSQTVNEIKLQKDKKKFKQLEQNSSYKKMLNFFPDVEIVTIKSSEEEHDE